MQYINKCMQYYKDIFIMFNISVYEQILWFDNNFINYIYSSTRETSELYLLK